MYSRHTRRENRLLTRLCNNRYDTAAAGTPPPPPLVHTSLSSICNICLFSALKYQTELCTTNLPHTVRTYKEIGRDLSARFSALLSGTITKSEKRFGSFSGVSPLASSALVGVGAREVGRRLDSGALLLCYARKMAGPARRPAYIRKACVCLPLSLPHSILPFLVLSIAVSLSLAACIL